MTPSRPKTLAVLLPLALLAGSCAASKPALLGVVDGKLAPCPSAPHCVSSHVDRGSHSVKPLRYAMSRDEARQRLVEVIPQMAGAKIQAEARDYVRAEFTTKRFKWVDDVEMYIDDREKLIHFRSSSRTGYWDLGVNRRRIEEIRKRFLADDEKKKEPAVKRAQKTSRE